LLGGTDYQKKSVLLADLSPQCAVREKICGGEGTVCEPTVYNVILSGSRTDKIASEITVTGLGSLKTKTSEMSILFQDRDLADRVAKAFQHLIELSGGKPEVF
jgi:hypothetical protein